ncbi:hypothetical protein ACVWYU_001804 [Pseudomonas sp. TE12234]
MAGLTKEQKAAKALLEKAVELSGLKAEEFALLSAEEQAAYTAKAQEAIDDASKKPVDEEVDNYHLIAVTKDGETLEVHPSALADHKRIGWKEA